MANGKGVRWDNHGGIPKHLIEINGETLLARIVRQVSERDANAELIISSSDPRCETQGARRHVPLQNELEIDRFVLELIVDDVTFLYGDTYYSDQSLDEIIKNPAKGLRFFGNEKSIVAVKSSSSAVLNEHLARVRKLFLDGAIKNCKGWQLYQSYQGLPFDTNKAGENFHLFSDETGDFNKPSDLSEFEKRSRTGEQR